MEQQGLKLKIDTIRDLIKSENYNAITEELKLINDHITDRDLKKEINKVYSRLYEIQHKELFGKKVDKEEKIVLHKAILCLTDEAEKLIHSVEIPEPSGIKTLSDENILSILNLFDKKSKEKSLTEKELADALDTKVKLYDLIFGQFDKQLETTYKSELPGVLFDRITSFDQIQKSDIDLLQRIRNNNQFTSKDRSLLVSGLTLSVINRFDSNKIHLLIDYLTDFEDDVWEKALVGLFLCLSRFDNRVNLFPDIQRRLQELKSLTDVQRGIVCIDRILRYRLFSLKDTFANNQTDFMRRFQMLFKEDITITAEDIDFFKEIENKETRSREDEICHGLLIPSKVKELCDSLEQQPEIRIKSYELFEFIDFKSYIELYELNPMQLNMDSELYKISRNWFVPFEVNDHIRNLLINDFQIPDIDIADFIKAVESNTSLNDIDKYAILTNISSYSVEFIEMIYMGCVLEKYYMAKEGVSVLQSKLLQFLRNLYRFQQLSITSQIRNIFQDKLDIYNKSLLDKVADKTVGDKIHAKVHYDNKRYEDSLKILHEIPVAGQDLEVLELFFENYMAMEAYEMAVPYVDKIISNLERNEASLDKKADWLGRISRLYEYMENMPAYEEYFEKGILMKEKIFKKSMLEDEFDEEKEAAGLSLAKDYFRQSIDFWNLHRDLNNSFSSLQKYFSILYEIPRTNTSSLEDHLIDRKKNFIALVEILYERESRKTDIRQILEALDDQSASKGAKMFYDLLIFFAEMTDLKADISYIESMNNFSEIWSVLSSLYEEMDTPIRNISKNPEIERVVVPFVFSNDKSLDVFVLIKTFFVDKEKEIGVVLANAILEALKIGEVRNEGDYFFDCIVRQDSFSSRFDSRKLKLSVQELLISAKINTNKVANDNTQNLSFEEKMELQIKKSDEMISNNPSDHEAYFERALAKRKLGRTEEAINDYNQAIELAPTKICQYYSNRGIAKFFMNQFVEAIADIDYAIKLCPNDDSFYFERGNIYFEWGKYEEAIDSFDKAMAINGNHTDSLNKKGEAYIKLGQKELACVCFKSALDKGNIGAELNYISHCEEGGTNEDNFLFEEEQE